MTSSSLNSLHEGIQGKVTRIRRHVLTWRHARGGGALFSAYSLMLILIGEMPFKSFLSSFSTIGRARSAAVCVAPHLAHLNRVVVSVTGPTTPVPPQVGHLVSSCIGADLLCP